MKKATVNTMCNLRLFLMIMYVIYGMMQEITVFSFITDRYYLPFVMLVVGGGVFVTDLFTHRRMFSGKYVVPLLIFMGLTAISMVANMRYGVYSNVVTFAYLVVELFIFYPFSGYRETAKRDFKVLAYVVTIFSFLLSIYTIISYLYYLEYTFVPDVGKGTVVEQGYQSIYRRAWGFYYETNWQGITSVIVMFLCSYLIKMAKSKAAVVWNVFNIVYHLIILILTGSRSSTFALYASVGVCVWFVAQKYLARFTLTAVKTHLLRIAAGVASVLVCMAALAAVKFLLPKLQVAVRSTIAHSTRVAAADAIKSFYAFNDIEVTFKGLEEDGPQGEGNKDEPIEEEKIERLDILNKDDKFNGRVYIWVDALKVLMKSPLIGTSPENYAEFAADQTPDVTQEILYGQSMRNGYLQLLLQGGVLGFAAMAFFLVLCVLKVFRYKYGKNGHCTHIGLLVGAIVALCVFILFSSDLFYIRSGLTYLFWIMLGYGLYLIEEDEHAQKTDEALFVCDTPYQVVNAINLAQLHDRADIYIYDQFSTAKSVAENLKATNIFRNVVLVKRYKSLHGAANKLLTLFRVFAPEYTLKKHLDRKLFKTDYGTVYVSFFTPFIDSVRLSNPQATFVQYEDGVGSYYIDDLENAFRSGLFKWINKFLLNDKMSYKIDTLYLNHPECYGGQNFQTVAAMPKWESSDVLEAVFDYQGNRLYADNQFVYLTQPLGETAMGEQASVVENEILAAVKDRVVLRVHPRQDKETYAGYTIDGVRNLWEIECARQITDEHILIGAFSTAQFTPKMLFDKEPTVIFTYKLFDGLFENADTTVEKLRAMYRQPEKIVVVNDVNELQTVLSACGVNDAK